ncbi:MAG TPA: chitobiase/beta-hexosaminidase C-terminal domain-containing protein [bacterium]|nr:chitobiase/beta-hexosaminidase C-terminal domain-containing protein [bacterium]HPN43493.1 chitobiase/beta-hexosaminidase C-terminal domain-containing protein [bacterium]
MGKIKSVIFVSVLLLFLFVQIAAAAQVGDTKFNVDRGYFSAPFQLVITTATAGASIYYTLDGSAPSAGHGTLYTKPVSINKTTIVRVIAVMNGMEPSDVDTQTFIFPDDIVNQPGNPAGFPAVWYTDLGSAIAADYEMDPEYPDNNTMIKDALLALPTVSLVVEPDELFTADGVYPNGGYDDNNDWEKACSIEMIFADTTRNFQVNCGIQPRSQPVTTTRKRSFKLDFKSEYGTSKLDEPVFQTALQSPTNSAPEFNSLILRAGYMENYTGKIYNPAFNIYFRDIMVRDAQMLASGFGTHNLFVHLYINGLYWGLYNLTESPDEHHLVNYHGGSQDDWLIVKSNPDSDDDGEVLTGDDTRYQVLLDLIIGENLAGLVDYQNVIKYLDAQKFAEYMILQNYYAVGDWPDNNWVFVMKNGLSPAPGFFYAWDAEKAWLENDDPQSYLHSRYSPYLTDPTLANGRSYRAIPSRLWRAMITSPEFKILFADCAYKLMYQYGILSDDASQNRFLQYSGHISTAVRADQKRWADDNNRTILPGQLFTHTDWQNQVNKVLSNIQNNVTYFINDFRAAGLYPNLDPPLFNQYGGNVAKGFVVTITNPNGSGEIMYTLDGADPRQAGGAVHPNAVSGGTTAYITINNSTHIKSRIKNGSEWSPLQDITFYTPMSSGDLKITEIMYHPPAVGNNDGDDYEFIELKNTGDDRINLAGITFADGITYTFPNGAFLDAGSFVVLSKNSSKFYSKYGITSFANYDGNLNNGGEKITLRDPAGNSLFSVTYDDKSPWPTSPDGDGYSLVPVNFNTNPNPNNAANWRASKYEMGSPGMDDSVRYTPPQPPAGPVTILFVTSSANLDADDNAVRTRLLSRDYIVLVKEQNTVTAADAAGKNLVLISGSVNSGAVNTKFRNVAVPVLLCDPYLFDDMGMTNATENVDYGVTSNTTLNIIQPDHPASAGFSGTVQVTTTPLEMAFAVPNNNARIIAAWQGDAGKAAIFVYEQAATMIGLTAPARRAGFFINSGITGQMTANGWKLFDAVVDWAMNRTTAIHDTYSERPQNFTLAQNYPNPFNPVTTIAYSLPVTAWVEMQIINIQGQLVKTLCSNEQAAGDYTVAWNGVRENGLLAASGVYFYKLTVTEKSGARHIYNRKMLLVK